jgi:hypothetical protein
LRHKTSCDRKVVKLSKHIVPFQIIRIRE